MQNLRNQFGNRQALIDYVQTLAPWAEGDASEIQGGLSQGLEKLQAIDPINYGKTRNFADGKITQLSPYVHHGIIDLNQIRNEALRHCSQPEQIIKFVQELAWRDFWQRVAEHHPEWVWKDVEPYKTGFKPQDYAEILPDDITSANTGIACIDRFIEDLINTGYLHNHTRMYIASYIVHFRRIKWQAGAKWFLSHLLDGDEASNNLSWQWVASTFSNKPYIFNLENVDKYFGMQVDMSSEHNAILDASYQQLTELLFPNLVERDRHD